MEPLEKVRDTINSVVGDKKMPAQGYESTVGTYGARMKFEADEKLVWDNRGLVAQFDTWGDAILRTYDDHVVKDIGSLLKRHPKLFFKFLMPGIKRYRGSKEEIFKNAKRLGLDDLYGLHEHGIEIKKPDVYLKGVQLQDIYRADVIDNEALMAIDRFEALAQVSAYLRTMHDAHGGIGQALVPTFLFSQHGEGMVSDPVFSIPDVVFNEDKVIGEKEKKAIDILDFVMSVGAEEFRRSGGDEVSVLRALTTVVVTYGDADVLELVGSYIIRGRLTFAGDVDSKEINLPKDSFTTRHRGLFTKHNEVRVVNNRSLEKTLKEMMLKLCKEYARGKTVTPENEGERGDRM